MYPLQIGSENPTRRSGEAWKSNGPQPLPMRQADSAEPSMLGRMAGHSLAMQHLFSRLKSTAPWLRMAAVEGEAGTGKLLTARTLHQLGPSLSGPFAPYAAREFLENPDRVWRNCRGGLLWLGHVDELSPEDQRLLRDFLERAAHERMRLGAASGPLQVLAGSSQPLRRLSAAGGFRADLASHLTAIRFPLPPLRDRREDIPLLAGIFLRNWAREHGKQIRGFGPGTLERLAAYDWPGNVRELENSVAAAALDCPGQWIRPVDLPQLQWPAPTPEPLCEAALEDPNLDHAILRHVMRVLTRANGNKVRAARMLGISRSTLYRLLDPGEDGTHRTGPSTA